MQDIPAIVAAARAGTLRRHGQHLGDAAVLPAARLGVDIAIEAGTKYLSGHSDLLLGLTRANAATGRRCAHLH